jgi:ankyrin repeat protein
MDAKQLPPHPNLEQYKKQAKELVKACKSAGGKATWAGLASRFGFTPAQLLQRLKRYHPRLRKLPESRILNAPFTLADAQWVIAREHAFDSWPKFKKYIEASNRASSPVSKFELAADAIVSGDLATLRKLLRENPELIRARSTREHRSTLLHYVSANGVEDFRQKTPRNIIEITKLLLEAGADVNAESDAYGGRSTTLGLTATSCHPEEAGVQIPLMELLIHHGAIIDGPDGGSEVNGCLHNGRKEAAEFFASHGARLDLEGAAGVGRLDVVKSFFNDDGTLRPSATQQQLKDGFAWACEFGRTAVVEFLLQSGVGLDAKLKHHGQTGLHWAAYGGWADTVKLLLERGARVDARDENFDGTPLEWALYEWGNSPLWAERGQYYEVVALLVRAGATLDPHWHEGDKERQRALDKVRSDPRMLAALRGALAR